jgi:hypothetical protein
LNCRLLLLWGEGLGQKVEVWRMAANVDTLTLGDLLELGYPEPRGELYYCITLTNRVPGEQYAQLDRAWVEQALARLIPRGVFGAPAELSWEMLQARTKHGYRPEPH